MKNRNISFEYPQKSLLKSNYPKLIAKIFLSKKIPKSSLSLEICSWNWLMHKGQILGPVYME